MNEHDDADAMVLNQITEELQRFADKLCKRGLPAAFLVEAGFLHSVTLYMHDTHADLRTAVEHFRRVLDKLADAQEADRRPLH